MTDEDTVTLTCYHKDYTGKRVSFNYKVFNQNQKVLTQQLQQGRETGCHIPLITGLPDTREEETGKQCFFKSLNRHSFETSATDV